MNVKENSHSIHDTNFQLFNIKIEQKICWKCEKKCRFSYLSMEQGSAQQQEIFFCCDCSCLLMLKQLLQPVRGGGCMNGCKAIFSIQTFNLKSFRAWANFKSWSMQRFQIESFPWWEICWLNWFAWGKVGQVNFAPEVPTEAIIFLRRRNWKSSLAFNETFSFLGFVMLN